MQRNRILRAKPSNQDNILFQSGYSDYLTFEELTGMSSEDAFQSLPYWIVINHMTRQQLLFLVNDLMISIPKNCSKTRKALANLLIPIYSKWKNALTNSKTIPTLRKHQVFIREI